MILFTGLTIFESSLCIFIPVNDKTSSISELRREPRGNAIETSVRLRRQLVAVIVSNCSPQKLTGDAQRGVSMKHEDSFKSAAELKKTGEPPKWYLCNFQSSAETLGIQIGK